MEHPWPHWLRFRKNQLEGPCEDHILAIKEPCFGHFWKRELQDTPRNVKFSMEHPWAHWLRFRKNQFEGPCEDHVLAIEGYIWPFLGEGAAVKTQQCDLWHGTSLGAMTKIWVEPTWSTMWAPCFGHKRAMFWPFLGKRDYGIHPELWNLAWSIPGHIDYNSGQTIWRTMWGPCFGHKRAIFGHF